jgi:3-dehydroquinate dehydratase
MPHSVSSETDPVLITVAGIREMGQVKLEKHQKAWLVEAVNACLAHIDLLDIDLLESKDGTNDSKVRS